MKETIALSDDTREVEIDISAQPTRNIPGIFTECSISVAMFGTSREHLGNILKENIF